MRELNIIIESAIQRIESHRDQFTCIALLNAALDLGYAPDEAMEIEKVYQELMSPDLICNRNNPWWNVTARAERVFHLTLFKEILNAKYDEMFTKKKRKTKGWAPALTELSQYNRQVTNPRGENYDGE